MCKNVEKSLANWAKGLRKKWMWKEERICLICGKKKKEPKVGKIKKWEGRKWENKRALAGDSTKMIWEKEGIRE